MKKLLNTLYVLNEDAYLSLNGETVEMQYSDSTKKSVPLHLLDSIVCFSYKGASPALMGKCSDMNIQLSFFTPRGRYLASVSNNVNGNVLLRRHQYRIADSKVESLKIAKNMQLGKLYNSQHVLMRALRDHPMQVDRVSLEKAVEHLRAYSSDIQSSDNIDSVRGIEGNAAAEYFGVFNELILQNKSDFTFLGRSRRPPLDPINAMLSFAYVLLANDCASALHSVGLDPFVGFMHTDRPGRKSLALDIMEELRSVIADRFVITMINNRMINSSDFDWEESGRVIIKDDARKNFLSEWQKRKREELTHPFLKEKISWGLVPYVQSMLLSRHLRGDLDQYPPFFWK